MDWTNLTSVRSSTDLASLWKVTMMVVEGREGDAGKKVLHLKFITDSKLHVEILCAHVCVGTCVVHDQFC